MYISFYGLREEPFRLTPDPRFLHLAEPHRAALTTLLQGVISRKGFIVATGPVGTGKTTLLHATLRILTHRLFTGKRVVSAFLVHPTLTREELLEALLDELEVRCPSASKPRRLQALHELCLETQRQGGTTLIIIDEAHLLTPELLEEIRLLSNADTYREKPLQIILSGQPELLSTLEDPRVGALRQRIASRCRLRPLSLAETRAYVAERLHAAGLRGDSPFNGGCLEEVYRFSAGVPRLINLLCDDSLTIGHQQQRKPVTPDIVASAAQNLGFEPALDVSATPADPPGSARASGQSLLARAVGKIAGPSLLARSES